MPRPALAISVATAVAVAGVAAGAVIFLPAKPKAFTPEQTAAGSTASAGSQTNALASALQVSALAMSRDASKAVAASNRRGATTKSGGAAGANPGHHRRRMPQPAAPVYLNPLRAVSGLQPQRIDMGADFAGSGPIYPIGDGVITSATGNSSGWPGGGWITYQLTDGPAAGLVVYVAEDVRPTVSVGTKVTPTTVIADMFNGGVGIETGWAMPDSSSAESQLPDAGGISGGGPFPTKVGVSFDDLLQALGVPAAPNASQSAYGLLPPSYLLTWSGLR